MSNLLESIVVLKTSTEIIIGKLVSTDNKTKVEISKPHVLVPMQDEVKMFPYEAYFPFFKDYSSITFNVADYVIAEADTRSRESYKQMTSVIITQKTPSIIIP
jgi:hypothetical protein